MSVAKKSSDLVSTIFGVTMRVAKKIQDSTMTKITFVSFPLKGDNSEHTDRWTKNAAD
jgi:hypothetical protein